MKLPRSVRNTVAAAVLVVVTPRPALAADDAPTRPRGWEVSVTTTETRPDGSSGPPTVEVLFPNASPAPEETFDRGPTSEPRTKKTEPKPLRLGAGAGALVSGFGTTPNATFVLDLPTSSPRATVRVIGDAPLGSATLERDGATSEASVWMLGGGVAVALNDPASRVTARVNGAWGGTILHVRGVSSEPGLVGRRPADLFTLMGHIGLELGAHVAGPVGVVAQGRIGTTLTRLVVDHGRGTVGDWGVPFMGADLRVEVKL